VNKNERKREIYQFWYTAILNKAVPAKVSCIIVILWERYDIHIITVNKSSMVELKQKISTLMCIIEIITIRGPL